MYHRHGKGDRCIRGRKKDVADQEISEEFVGLLEERRMVQKGVREKGMVPLLK